MPAPAGHLNQYQWDREELNLHFRCIMPACYLCKSMTTLRSATAVDTTVPYDLHNLSRRHHFAFRHDLGDASLGDIIVILMKPTSLNPQVFRHPVKIFCRVGQTHQMSCVVTQISDALTVELLLSHS